MASKEEQIIEAMEIVTKKLIAAADFDRTIQATIVSCEDASIGKYKLRYQDGSFYAFSSSPDLKYSKGKTVYVLVPGNDMSRDKTILGGTDKVAPASINTMENLEAYEILGNIVSMVPGQENSFGLHSYKKDGEEIILYNKDDDSQNKININEAAFLRYLDFDKEANKIALRAKFTTKLPTEQQIKGNFGVKVTIKIADTEEKDFFLDVDNMIGQPYKQTNVLQEVPYDLPELKNNALIEIKRISIFCENFPHFKTENLEEDIFIKDFKIDCISLLPSDQIETGYITLLAEPKDGWDDASKEFFKAIRYTAQLQFGNNKVNSDEQSLRYFWFKQNASIDNASPEYYSIGGRGWECLNKYNEDEKGNREWVSNSFYWFGMTEDSYDPTDMEYDGWIIPATDLNGKYKVVIIYNDTTYIKEFTIHNIHQKNRISLVNTGSDTFRWGNGHTDLECHIEDKDDSKIYNYYWNYSDSNGITSFEPSEDDKSKYRAYAVDILNHRTFSCTVYEKTQSEEGKGKCIGTDSVTIYNFNEDENGYLLEIINGKQAFQYDNNGVSPCNVNNVVPQNTLPLSFNLYDEKHNEINDFSNWTIRWKVPATDTLISISKKDISILEEKDGYYYINAIKKNEGGVTEKLSLPFAIANEFNYNFTNNNIELIANDEPTPDNTEEEMTRILVSASTDFFINKMGAAGTHGDEYVAKLCLKSNTEVGLQYLLCRIFTEDNKVFGQINNSDIRIGDTVSTEGLFTPTLYNLKTNQIITNELNSVKFEFLTLNKEDISFYNITKDGKLSLNLSDKTITKDNLSIGDKIPNHLLKCSFIYNNKTFFTIIPIITIISQNDNIYLSDINIEGKTIVYNKNYGFYFVQYTSDGNEPQYDSNNPFYININEEQALSYNYNWGIKGSNLDYEEFKNSPKNQKFYKPKSVYKDGSVNNAVYCNITDELNTTIAEVHIPIYFYKNTYGMDMLNEWDGTTLKINDEGGYILSPIVGAGKKDSEKNTFTGVLMGEVKEANKTNPDIGIMGYADGKRTFFVDAEDGHAQFGYDGNGITIDPTKDEALIYNKNFWQNSNIDTESGLPKDYEYRDFNGSSIEERIAPKDIVDNGMIINLTNPDIYMAGRNKDGNRTITDISNGEIFSTEGKIGSLYYGAEGLTTGYNANENIRILTNSGSYVGRNLQIADNTPLGLGGYISLKSEKDDNAEKTILYRSYIEMEDGHFADYDSKSNQTLLMHMDTDGEGHIGSILGKVTNPESAAARADVELVLAKAKGTNEKGVYVQDGQGNLVNIYAKNLNDNKKQEEDSYRNSIREIATGNNQFPYHIYRFTDRVLDVDNFHPYFTVGKQYSNSIDIGGIPDISGFAGSEKISVSPIEWTITFTNNKIFSSDASEYLTLSENATITVKIKTQSSLLTFHYDEQGERPVKDNDFGHPLIQCHEGGHPFSHSNPLMTPVTNAIKSIIRGVNRINPKPMYESTYENRYIINYAEYYKSKNSKVANVYERVFEDEKGNSVQILFDGFTFNAELYDKLSSTEQYDIDRLMAIISQDIKITTLSQSGVYCDCYSLKDNCGGGFFRENISITKFKFYTGYAYNPKMFFRVINTEFLLYVDLKQPTYIGDGLVGTKGIEDIIYPYYEDFGKIIIRSKIPIDSEVGDVKNATTTYEDSSGNITNYITYDRGYYKKIDFEWVYT